MFLCTFGTLTHTHAWIGGEVNATEAIETASLSNTSVAGPARIAVEHHASGATHCAFCEWQANSVSTALPIQHCVSPLLVAIAAPRQTLIPVTVRIVRTSSRAPPIA